MNLIGFRVVYLNRFHPFSRQSQHSKHRRRRRQPLTLAVAVATVPWISPSRCCPHHCSSVLIATVSSGHGGLSLCRSALTPRRRAFFFSTTPFYSQRRCPLPFALLPLISTKGSTEINLYQSHINRLLQRS